MSAQREPDVIERMAVAHWTEHCTHLGSDEEMAPYSWWQESMLAAVRELWEHAAKQDNAFKIYVEGVLSDHERRAGGKGE